MATLDERGEVVECGSSVEGGKEAELVHRYDRGPAVLLAVARETGPTPCDSATDLIREVAKRVRAGVFNDLQSLPADRNGCRSTQDTETGGTIAATVCGAIGAGLSGVRCPVNPTRTLRDGLSIAVVAWPDLITSLQHGIRAFVAHEDRFEPLGKGECGGCGPINVNPLAFGDTVALATSNGMSENTASRIAHDLRSKVALRDICRAQARREAENRPGETAVVSLIQFTRVKSGC